MPVLAVVYVILKQPLHMHVDKRIFHGVINPWKSTPQSSVYDFLIGTYIIKTGKMLKEWRSRTMTAQWWKYSWNRRRKNFNWRTIPDLNHCFCELINPKWSSLCIRWTTLAFMINFYMNAKNIWEHLLSLLIFSRIWRILDGSPIHDWYIPKQRLNFFS